MRAALARAGGQRDARGARARRVAAGPAQDAGAAGHRGAAALRDDRGDGAHADAALPRCAGSLLTIPVLLGVATLVFALIHLVPGDPAQAMLGERRVARGRRRRCAHALGLDRPLLAQYGAFLGGLVTRRPRHVVPLRARRSRARSRERLPATLELAAGGDAGRDRCVAIPLGIVAAVLRGHAPSIMRR